jgi:predicted Fe-S protein YdhL (DUF1289 family)
VERRETKPDVVYNKTSCQGECYFDKELQACGTCYRTLEEIKNEHYKLKEEEHAGDNRCIQDGRGKR